MKKSTANKIKPQSANTYVIIGNGFAGIWAIEGIRQLDKENPIILISDEDNYSRPLISYYLGKRVKSSLMPYRDEEFFKNNKVTLKIGQRVTKIDQKNNNVQLKNGESITYSKLLIATGGKPIKPPMQNSDAKGVFTFTTYSEAKQIKEYIEEYSVKHAVVIGGGLIGLKATEAMIDLGIEVTIVELADRILSATFDKKASGIIENALVEDKCRVIKENTVANIQTTNDRVSGVLLKSGEKLACELVIVAVGVKPDLTLLEGTTIKVNRGIIVNELMQTSDPSIFAAGDVAEVKGWVIAILPLATRQGRIAGMNMAGADEKYEGSLPMNSVELAGVPTISVGLTDPKENLEEYEILEKYNSSKRIYRKIVLKENVIMGVILIGEIDRAGIITGLIKNKVDVSPYKELLAQGNFGLISLPKEYRKSMVQGPILET
jgi:NAD(P)H-nitrite reductase large subunit